MLLTTGSLNIAFSPSAFSLSSGIILNSLQGTLALEEALSSGSPIRTEVDLLRKSLEGIDKDSLLELALSSLPEDVLEYGSDTRMELKQKVSSHVMYCCLNNILSVKKIRQY